jgi:predicted amidohydrolase
MAGSFKVACVQTNAARDPEPNVRAASELVRRARAAGADFILLPEIVNMLEPKRALLLEKAKSEIDDPALAQFRDLAAGTGAWLLVGSLVIKITEDRVANRSFLLDGGGGIVATYDKIHMFDVDLGDGERYHESRTYRAGGKAVVAGTPWGKLGMTVCYDMRFPHLYRALAKQGAVFLSVPSAFTRPTGRAHWHVLLRARAIENGCFVFAPAQCGEHAEGRKTYGHSLIVDPWGEVLADGGEEPGFAIAEIDPAKVEDVRRKVPSLASDRPFD